MRASDYIRALEAIVAEHGDVEVDTFGLMGRSVANAPKIAFRKILTRVQRRDVFWAPWDPPEQKGDKVIQI